jgi:putative endonuclease
MEVILEAVKNPCVYILSSRSKVLYIGVTSDLEGRLWQHREKKVDGFTSRYDVTSLVHLELYPDMDQAISREKQLKGWVRLKKVALILEHNPRWEDLSAS